VDFVLYGGKTFATIEVKNTNVLRPTDYNGLLSFGDDYPEARLLLLYWGTYTLKRNNILIIPVEIFLKNMLEYLEGKKDKRKK
jgi:hypothetical protein